jgi:RNA polymerase sigma-70 factor (ECF subfamily)
MAEQPLESTYDLVSRIRGGDDAARNRLIARYLPLLTRWAHGRLPHAARDLNETSDLVQTTLMRAFQNLPSFDVQGEGAFFGYLRQVTTNILRDELRRMGRRPLHGELPEELPESGPEPIQVLVTVETMAAYERALRDLDDEQREAVMLRIELGLPHEEIALAIGAPSPNAARMKVARALMRLAERMHEYR